MRDSKIGEDGKSEVFDYEKYENDVEIVEEAKRFLKLHQNLLPKLTGDGETVVLWSSEALKLLWENYEPKDRIEPALWVVCR